MNRRRTEYRHVEPATLHDFCDRALRMTDGELMVELERAEDAAWERKRPNARQDIAADTWLVVLRDEADSRHLRG